MAQRILVILGHPSSTSFCSALADTYIQSAKNADHEVRVLRLGTLAFDPVLHHGYTDIQALEADLLGAQADILWATHLAFVLPIWWGGIPALMKGLSIEFSYPASPSSTVQARHFPTSCCMAEPHTCW
jgi:NAD(P)H dehydrogenase (quinone)